MRGRGEAVTASGEIVPKLVGKTDALIIFRKGEHLDIVTTKRGREVPRFGEIPLGGVCCPGEIESSNSRFS